MCFASQIARQLKGFANQMGTLPGALPLCTQSVTLLHVPVVCIMLPLLRVRGLLPCYMYPVTFVTTKRSRTNSKRVGCSIPVAGFLLTQYTCGGQGHDMSMTCP